MASNFHGRKSRGQEEVMDLAFCGNVMLAFLKDYTAVTRPLHTSCFGEVHLLHTNSIWDLPEVIDDVTSDPTVVACPLTWVTRGIKGFLRARSGRDWNWIVTRLTNMRTTAVTKNFDSAAEKGDKNYISEVRESSLSLRDRVTPASVVVLNTAWSKWNNAKLFGAFAALWFFLVTKSCGDGPLLAQCVL